MEEKARAHTEDQKMRRDRDNGLPPRAVVVPYPALMNAAGTTWLIVGGLEILHTVAWYGLVGPNRIAGLPLGCCPSGPAAGWCAGLVGLPHLVAGYGTLTGRTRDTQGFGAVSVLLGQVQIFGSLVYGLAGTNAQNGKVPGALFVLSAIMGVLGAALVVAGGFALASRSAYRDWRRSKNLDRYQPPRRRPAHEGNPFEG